MLIQKLKKSHIIRDSLTFIAVLKQNSILHFNSYFEFFELSLKKN
jgi:hypothetical protein